MKYIWQMSAWPEFSYDSSALEDLIYKYAKYTGAVDGAFYGLRDNAQAELIIDLLVDEAIKTSEIEGEFLNRADVRSSICKDFGLAIGNVKIRDPNAKAIAELMLDVRHTYAQPISKKTLCSWHKLLFQEPSYLKKIKVGAWRTSNTPMQIVSGAIGKEVVHYEAPPSKLVAAEMKQFIDWFNATAPGNTDAIKIGPVRAAIAHLYFEVIHPFDDGNGRIGRAISEKALAQALGRPVLISISKTIAENKNAYYDALKQASRSLDITAWLDYFLRLLLQAQQASEAQIHFVISKAKYFDKHAINLNERQLKVLKKMFAAGPAGFEGGINARKYCALTKVSKATATRDLQDLLKLEAIKRRGSGRSVSYELNI